jgi:DNA repair protein RecO (recombination protein O)
VATRVEAAAAFVLHRRAFQETSVILDVLTAAHGRISLLAKGVRACGKTNRGAVLQPFGQIEIDYQGRGEMPLLTRAEVVGAPIALRGEALLCGLYLNELIVTLLAKGEAHPRVFASYQNTLRHLHGEFAHWSMRMFEIQLLEELGYGLDFRIGMDHVPITANRRYTLVADTGFAPCDGVNGGFSGAAISAIGEQQPPKSAVTLREVRNLTRQLLLPHLPRDGLRSWETLNQLTELHLR